MASVRLGGLPPNLEIRAPGSDFSLNRGRPDKPGGIGTNVLIKPLVLGTATGDKPGQCIFRRRCVATDLYIPPVAALDA